MRTIKLTHEQINLLVNSLMVASTVYHYQHKEQAAKFPDDKEARKYWFEKGNNIYDLAANIKNGEFDV